MKPDICRLRGLMMADGYLDINYDESYRIYRVKLAVKDEELIQTVVSALPSYCHLARVRRDGTLYLTAKSRALHEMLLEVWRLIAEGRYDELIQKMDDEGVSAFIRGFFDGDGSGLFVYFTNTDLNLLGFIRYALKRFGIETSQQVPDTKKGTSAYHGPKRQ